MTHAVHPGGRAAELVDRLRADWRGERWDDVVIDDVRLRSPAAQWPPVIELDYRIGDQRGRWAETWEGETLHYGDLQDASSLFGSIVGVRLMDLVQPPVSERR